MTSTLSGRVTLTVSSPSGQSCTIAALASGRVDQLHGAVERTLKIPRVLQRLIYGGREICSHDFLAQLQMENGSNILVINSWPQKPELIVEKLHLAASATASHALAAAVVQCLEHEDNSVQVAALSTLSWMGRIAAPHSGAIARLLSHDQRGVRSAAAEALSWLEEAGAVFAADILANACVPIGRFGRVRLVGKGRKVVIGFFESDSSSTRLAAIKSVITLLESGERQITPAASLSYKSFLLPHICRAFFDPSDDVRKTTADYLISCMPFFSAVIHLPGTLTPELTCQFLFFGERVNLDESSVINDDGLAFACNEISRKLDSYWPKWVGWQEGLNDPETSAEAAAAQVSVATVHYLRRRFCEWHHDRALQARFEGQHDRLRLQEVADLLHTMVEHGLSSRKWQVRQAVVQSLISLEPWGANAASAVHAAKGNEKDRQVLETMNRFTAKYGPEIDDTRQLFMYLGDDWSEYFSDDDHVENLESEEDCQLRDKSGGYLKSHLSRTARHNKKHGVDSSRAPSTIARQKKWERRTRQEETQSFAESKRKNQRDKQQDRQLKTAMLGHDLLRFALDDAIDALENSQ